MKINLVFCVVCAVVLGLSGFFAGYTGYKYAGFKYAGFNLGYTADNDGKYVENIKSGDSFVSSATRALLGGLIMTAHAQDSDPQVQASIDYVNSLTDDCVYDHGYQCASIDGDTFLEPDSESRRIPGRWLEAWPAALTALVTSEDLTTEQKLLRHYKIGFAEDESHFLILFDALSLPMLDDGKVVGLMTVSIGMSTKVWVDKKTLSVTDMKFLR